MARERLHPSPKTCKVGYGRPPETSRWRSGQSGNPSGKRKGTKNGATILHEIMQQKITVVKDGKSRKITVHEGLYLNLVGPGLKGNLKAARFLLDEYAVVQGAEAARDADRVVVPLVSEHMSTKEAAEAYAATVREFKRAWRTG